MEWIFGGCGIISIKFEFFREREREREKEKYGEGNMFRERGCAQWASQEEIRGKRKSIEENTRE